MRILVALGGNALLQARRADDRRRQRANVRTAARALAPVAEHHQLVLSHGNGPRSASSPCRRPPSRTSRPTPSTCWARRRRG